MDRDVLLKYLAQAERHVLASAEQLGKQHTIIARLQSDGHDTTEARALLTEFEKSHQLHLAGLVQIREQLSPDKRDVQNPVGPAN